MATRTIADGGGNWSSNSTWVEGAAPTSSDAVVATATSGNVTIDTTSCVCSTMVLTNYVGTMTFTSGQKLTVTTTVTFVSGMTLAGTGTLQLSNTATITSGGLTFPGSLIFDAGTWTLADNWTVTGSVTGQTGTNTLKGNTLYVGASLTATRSFEGTTNIILNGSGTLSSSGSNYVANNLTINTSGTIVMGAVLRVYGGYFDYTAGTVDVSTNNNILMLDTSVKLNVHGVKWNTIAEAGGHSTHTLESDLDCASIICTTSYYIYFFGAYNISCDALSIGPTPKTVKLTSGQTLSISTSMNLNGSTVSSYTPSSAMYLNYSGTIVNGKVVGSTFTDVDASGSAQVIPNYNGGTLTRTTNITNYTAADLAINGFPAASKVYAGTDRGDGTLGTLHASNISTAAGGGSNLSAGILLSGYTVDDVIGSASGGGSSGGMGGIFGSILKG